MANKKFRVIECFGGIGACTKALKRIGLDVEIVDYIELDKYAVNSFNAINNTLFPVQDITKWDKDYKDIDLVCGGFPCFPAGTLVLTDKGYVEIEKIKIGDKVLTHKGRWKTVTNTGSKIANTIKLQGNHYGLECTPNHPIYCADIKQEKYKFNSGWGRKLNFNKTYFWVRADEMKDRYWGTPTHIDYIPIAPPVYSGNGREKEMPVMNEAFFYFIGRWLGDGWVRNGQRSGRPKGQTNGQIFLCDSYDKENELINVVSRITDKYGICKEKTVVKIRFCSKVLCDWLVDNFGKGALHKRIPSWVYCLEKDYRKSLLKGYFDSDGHRFKNGLIRGYTVSKKLAMGLRTLGESLGYTTTIYFNNVKPTTVIEGRTVNQHNNYIIDFNINSIGNKNEDGLHSWYKVKGITEGNSDVVVYNLSVEEDNSYIADSIVVHNCQDVSIAGKQAGIVKGKTRSGLMYELLRVIEKLKPKYAIAENVKNLLSKKHKDKLDEYISEMDRIGYHTKYEVLNAKDFGVPQNRERVFIVSIRNDIDKDFTFPEKQELKIFLKDLLEDKVDEKYFLSDKLIKCFSKEDTGGYPRKEQFEGSIDREVGKCVTTKAGSRPVDNFVRQ